MYICLCHGVTDRAIREAAQSGARDLSDLSAMTGCGTGCGSCMDMAGRLLEESRSQGVPLGLPIAV